MNINHQIQTFILYQYRIAAHDKKHHPFLKSLGFDEQMISRLRDIPPESLDILVRSKPFDISISTSLLASKLRSISKKDELEKLVTRALRLGASRIMLNELVGLSDTEYRRIKNATCIESSNKRYKPRRVSEYWDEIAELHLNIANSMKRQGIKPSPLELLIKLSESTNLEINRIYHDYYKKVEGSFHVD